VNGSLEKEVHVLAQLMSRIQDRELRIAKPLAFMRS